MIDKDSFKNAENVSIDDAIENNESNILEYYNEAANVDIEELMKTKGQEFLKEIFPKGVNITDVDWDEVLKAPDIAENIKIYKENNGSEDMFMPGFMAGLSAGARYGIIAMITLFGESIGAIDNIS